MLIVRSYDLVCEKDELTMTKFFVSVWTRLRQWPAMVACQYGRPGTYKIINRFSFSFSTMGDNPALCIYISCLTFLFLVHCACNASAMETIKNLFLFFLFKRASSSLTLACMFLFNVSTISWSVLFDHGYYIVSQSKTSQYLLPKWIPIQIKN